jgi:Rha family phage regulatory protein
MNIAIANQPQGGSTLADLVFEDGKKAVTNSLKVAKAFHKRHDNVIRDIENLGCSEEFALLNFEESLYETGGKQQKYYLIKRDGFAFLCMGFTGKEAAKFKEDFIAAFNKMEAALRSGFANKASIQDKFMKDCKFFSFMDSQSAKVLKKANERVIAEAGVDVLADYGWSPSEHGLVGRFWEYYDHISRNCDLNHSNHPDREIAVNLAQFEAECKKAGLDPINYQGLRHSITSSETHKYLRTAAVYSRLEKRTIRCWIFVRMAE